MSVATSAIERLHEVAKRAGAIITDGTSASAKAPHALRPTAVGTSMRSNGHWGPDLSLPNAAGKELTSGRSDKVTSCPEYTVTAVSVQPV